MYLWQVSCRIFNVLEKEEWDALSSLANCLNFFHSQLIMETIDEFTQPSGPRYFSSFLSRLEWREIFLNHFSMLRVWSFPVSHIYKAQDQISIKQLTSFLVQNKKVTSFLILTDLKSSLYCLKSNLGKVRNDLKISHWFLRDKNNQLDYRIKSNSRK